jgi:galactokinase
MKKGLSSSAAVCVLVATCFNLVYGLNLDRDEVMEIAYQGERLTPSQCGRMDQCVAMGSGSIGFMEFNYEYRSLRQLSCAQPLYFVVADIKAGKDTMAILCDLSACFPYPQSKIQVIISCFLKLFLSFF